MGNTRHPRIDPASTIRRLAVCGMALALAVVVGCTSDEPRAGGSPTAAAPGPTATATVRVSPTVASPSPEPPRPAPRESTGFGVWLIDTESQQVRVLHESAGYLSARGFSADGESVWVYLAAEHQSARFALDGSEQQRVAGFVAPATGRPRPDCRNLQESEPAAEIDGERYEVNCGAFSPDGRRMLYIAQTGTVDAGSGYLVPVYSTWLLDLASGQRTELQDEMRHCGGCDGRAGPVWSPSGRYVIHAELYSGSGGSRVFLSDVEAGSTRQVTSGADAPSVNEIGRMPQWSTNGDVLLRPAPGGGTAIEDVVSGAITSLPDVPWPARFGDGESYIYSPASTSYPQREETVIADAASGAIVARWKGSPPGWPVPEGGIVVDAEGEPAAALQVPPSGSLCNGTTIHHPQAPDDQVWVERACGAVWSPDAVRVAFARHSGGGAATVWEVAFVDVATGAETVLAGDIPGYVPPLLFWHPEGRALLVVWPGPMGI